MFTERWLREQVMQRAYWLDDLSGSTDWLWFIDLNNCMKDLADCMLLQAAQWQIGFKYSLAD